MLAIIHGSSPTLKEPKKWSKEFNGTLRLHGSDSVFVYTGWSLSDTSTSRHAIADR
jgi:hypothetical protein